MVASTCFTGFLVFEFKYPGLVGGIFWSLIIAYIRLVIGANTLNQIFFGVSIGIWICCLVFFLINFDKQMTTHFQMIIRGRVLIDDTWIKPWIFASTGFMYLIYSGFYFYAQYEVNNQVTKYNDYFHNI